MYFDTSLPNTSALCDGPPKGISGYEMWFFFSMRGIAIDTTVYQASEMLVIYLVFSIYRRASIVNPIDVFFFIIEVES